MMKKLRISIIALLLLCCPGFCREVLDLFPERPGSLVCWTESRDVPRPLKIHYLKAALNGSGLEAFALPGEDPDGPGPAESRLTQPEELLKKFHALAAVNANAFAGLPGDAARAQDWYEGRAVNIHGTVVSEGKVVSPLEDNRAPFWLDTRQKPHIGPPPSMDAVAEAVADWFSPLLIDARVIPDPADRVLHPRTAVGFDNTGTWILLIVVDGRQPGFSEGVSLYELAQILQAEGCTQSINLDGGGSSIMLVQEPGKDVRSINSPSGRTHRPVPVMLGIRRSARP